MAGPAITNRDVLVIGASTGGLDALRIIFGDLPPDLPASVVVHVDIDHVVPVQATGALLATLTLAIGGADAGHPARYPARKACAFAQSSLMAN